MADDTLQEVRERLIRIEVLLEQHNANIELKIQALNERVSKLESTISWIWKAIGGALISAIVALLINLK